MTICPFCRGDIPDDAHARFHCGEWPDDSQGNDHPHVIQLTPADARIEILRATHMGTSYVVRAFLTLFLYFAGLYMK